MNLYSKENLPPPSDDLLFRISPWGPLFGFLIFLSGLVAGLALFIHSVLSSIAWGILLSALYTLIMWGICRVLLRALKATFSPANWLARIGHGGILLKYRSYLHDDSPEEDPIALYLSWPEITEAQLQREIHTTTDMDGKRQIRRWFLTIRLNQRYVDMGKIKSLLAFESQRKPAHFRVNDLKHELFIARKNKAPRSEVENIKNEIASEKKRHPGRHGKVRFHDRPVIFVNPDQLKVEWTHVTPGRQKLRQLLVQHTSVAGDQHLQFDIERPMTKTEFNSLLAVLLSRDEIVEATKLVKRQLGVGTTEAKAFIENARLSE